MARNSSLGEILAPGDAAQLINLDLVNIPSPPNGSIQIHKRRLNRTSDEENEHIPLYANIESRPHAFVTIPEKLISKATIEYVGFNSDKAREIWSGWIAWPSGPIIREIGIGEETCLEVSFIDWVKGHAGNPLSDDVWEDDNSAWSRYMEQRGIATDLQYAIMDPLFRDMRLTGTCIGWLRDTMEMRYEGLRNIQRASAEQSEAFCHPSGDMQHTSTEPSGSAFAGRHTLSVPTVMEDFTVLYKAMYQRRTDGLFDQQGILSRTSVLRSVPPTDFSENKTMYCFTPDYNLARKHAAWVKRRGPSAAIVQIAVQDSVITAIGPPDTQCAFWPNSNWGELIWHCRTETISKETADYGRAALIFGRIANRPNGGLKVY
ncbi:hypothetical protein ACKRZS_002255 [Fusarium odoratissimum]